MNKILLIALTISTLIGCGADGDNQSNIDITGSWERNNIPHDDLITDNIWTFKNDGTFSLASRLTGTDINGTNEKSSTGTFSVGSNVVQANGETATNIIIHFDGSDVPDLPTYVVPSIADEDMPDIAYIQDNTLYFGKRPQRMLEACWAIFLTGDAGESQYFDQYEVDPFKASIEEQATCYTRPTELDFDNPLYKIN